MKTPFIRFIVLAAVLSLVPGPAAAQIEASSSMILNRGKLWQTFMYGKSGPPFSNWTRRGIGLDWPGFDPSLISENIGGAPSYLVSGGLFIGTKWRTDSILTIEDWSMYSSSVAEGAAAKYRVTANKEVYPNGANYWLQRDGQTGEQVLKTVWEYNVDYEDQFQIRRMLPVRVTRTVHQWSGSKADENYIIVDYVIKNISPELRGRVPAGQFLADTLVDFYPVINYGIHCNARSWNVLFPSLSAGARNTWLNYSSSRRLMFGRAADYPETPSANEDMGYAASMGPTVSGKPSGEYLAPGYAGVKLLYASRDQSGQTSRIAQYGWSAASNSIDLDGPFTNLGSQEARYAALKDIRLMSNFVASYSDQTFMKKSRMWSLLGLGPYTILPGDSIRIVLAEMVDGIDYARAVDPAHNTTSAVIQDGQTILFNTAARAQLTFDNGMRHPNPPAAPKFTVDYNRNSASVANVLTWTTDAERLRDPYDNAATLAQYVVYRSNYLSIGPWKALDTIVVGDPAYVSGGTYTYVDSSVAIGQGYYYAVTSLSAPRASWTGVQTLTNVPAMETSIFANRTSAPFIATLPPRNAVDNVLVVPNPFVIGAGFSQPGVSDKIQFVNIPNPCTIRIYTMRGDLVKTLSVPQGAGAIVSWDQVTAYGQFVESGVYIFHVESPYGTKIGKFAIVR